MAPSPVIQTKILLKQVRRRSRRIRSGFLPAHMRAQTFGVHFVLCPARGWNPRCAAKRRNSESAFQPFGQHRHCLPAVEVQPQPRVAQHHHQGVAAAPAHRERPEVHLALTTRRCLKPHHRLHRLHRLPPPHRADVVPHTVVTATNIAGHLTTDPDPTDPSRFIRGASGGSPRSAPTMPPSRRPAPDSVSATSSSPIRASAPRSPAVDFANIVETQDNVRKPTTCAVFDRHE